MGTAQALQLLLGKIGVGKGFSFLPLGARRALGAFRTLGTLRTLGTFRTLGAFRALRDGEIQLRAAGGGRHPHPGSGPGAGGHRPPYRDIRQWAAEMNRAAAAA